MIQAFEYSFLPWVWEEHLCKGKTYLKYSCPVGIIFSKYVTQHISKPQYKGIIFSIFLLKSSLPCQHKECDSHQTFLPFSFFSTSSSSQQKQAPLVSPFEVPGVNKRNKNQIEFPFSSSSFNSPFVINSSRFWTSGIKSVTAAALKIQMSLLIYCVLHQIPTMVVIRKAW